MTVRLGALASNYGNVARRTAGPVVAPVVKADAYSLGMAPVAQALALAGADTFFVARLEEGIALRLLLAKARIYVLDGVVKETGPALVAHRLTPVLNSPDDITEWSGYAASRKTKLEAALHIDTGMNRSGLSREELSKLASRFKQSFAGITLNVIVSHLACAEEPDHPKNRVQLEGFKAALALLPPTPASLAASAGIELGRDYFFDMVRPGIGLYGGNPVPERPNPYRTVAVLRGRVLQLRRVEPGDTVGYGATFTPRRSSVVALVGLGYADGLIRMGGAKGHVFLGGVRVPFAGRISMDYAALDATDVPRDHLARGAEVEFFGDHIALSDVAAAAGTISHEVLTSILPRTRRVYVED